MNDRRSQFARLRWTVCRSGQRETDTDTPARRAEGACAIPRLASQFAAQVPDTGPCTRQGDYRSIVGKGSELRQARSRDGTAWGQLAACERGSEPSCSGLMDRPLTNTS